MTAQTAPKAVDYRTHTAEGNAFVQRVRGEDWAMYSADEFVANIKDAIYYDAVKLAKELTTRGAELFPDNKRLQGYVRVLVAPAAVQFSDKPTSPGVFKSSRWIAEHANHYRGKWIAVLDGELIGVADTAKQLVDGNPHLLDNADVFITRVLKGTLP